MASLSIKKLTELDEELNQFRAVTKN